MTKEIIAFYDFRDMTLNKFEDMMSLHENYNELYDMYSRVLADEPESRAAVFDLMKNVEQMQVAREQIHEQIL